jgi:DNA topoisomerase-3
MKLIITEKPSVAKDIANVLGVSSKNNGYYSNNEYFITYAFGHLISLAKMEYYNQNITLESLPIIPEKFVLKVTQDPGIKKQLNIIKTLSSKANSFICASDA